MEDDFYSSTESLVLTTANVVSLSTDSKDSHLCSNNVDLKPVIDGPAKFNELSEVNHKEWIPAKFCVQTMSYDDESKDSLFDDSRRVDKNSSDTCEERFDEMMKEIRKLPEKEKIEHDFEENVEYDYKDDSSNSSLNLVVDESDMMNKTSSASSDDDDDKPEELENQLNAGSLNSPKSSDDSSQKKSEETFTHNESLDMFDDLNSLSSDDFEGFSVQESSKALPSPLAVLQSAALKTSTKHDNDVALTRCSICLLSFDTAYEFFGHMKTKHGDIACVKPFLCVHCNMKYKNYRTLYGHARIAHPTIRSRKQFISEPNRSQSKRGRPRKIKLPVSTNLEMKENKKIDISQESMKTNSTALQETDLNGIPSIPRVKRPYKKKHSTTNSPLTLESYNKFIKIRKSVRVPKFKNVGKDFISFTEDDPSRLLSRNRFKGAISSKIVGFTKSLNLIPNSEKVIEQYKDDCYEDIHLQPVDEDNNFIPLPTDNSFNNYVKSIEERFHKNVNLLPKSLLAPDHKFFAKNSAKLQRRIAIKRPLELEASIIETPNKISRITVDCKPQEKTELITAYNSSSQKHNINEKSLIVPSPPKDKSSSNLSSISTNNARRSTRTPKYKIDKDFITWTEQNEAPTYNATESAFSGYISHRDDEILPESVSEPTSLMAPRKKKLLNSHQTPIPNLVIKTVTKKRGRKRKRHRLTARKTIRYIYKQDDSEEEMIGMESIVSNDKDETNVSEEPQSVSTGLSTSVQQIEDEKVVKETKDEAIISDTLVLADEEKVLPTVPKRTEILYENENSEEVPIETNLKHETAEEVRPTMCPYTAIIPEELLNIDFGALGYYIMRNNKLEKIDISPSDIFAESFNDHKTAETSCNLGVSSDNRNENTISGKEVQNISTRNEGKVSCCAGTSTQSDGITIIEQLEPFANNSPTGSDMQAALSNVDVMDVENKTNDDFDASIKCEEWFNLKKNVSDTDEMEHVSDDELDLTKMMLDLKSVSESRDALMNDEECELNFDSSKSTKSSTQEGGKNINIDFDVRRPKFPPVLYCKFCTFKTRGTSLLSLHSLEHDSSQEEECRRQSMLMLGDTVNLIHCQLCPYVTDKMSSFSYHMKQHEKLKHLSSRKKLSTIIRNFQCKLCSFKTNRPSSYTRHKKRHEMKSSRLKFRKARPILSLPCPFCKLKATTKSELRNHLFDVHQDKCVLGSPSAPSKTKPSLSKNYENSVVVKSFKALFCHLCNFSTRSLMEFVKHANSHKTESTESNVNQPSNIPTVEDVVSVECEDEVPASISEDEKEKVTIPKYMSGDVKCIHCNFCCYSKQKLTEHFSEKHKTGVNTCSKCEFEADDVVVFVDHYYDHMKKIVKRCNQCIYGTIYESCYNRHMLRHSSSASVSSTSNSLLKKYKNRVGYNCKDCNFSTIHQNVFKRHVNLKHNTKKIYQCTWKPCEFRTYRENLLIRHINRKHRSATSKTLHACTYCDFKAKSENQLAVHTRKHLKGVSKQCPYCDFKSSDESSYSYHIRRHTGEGMVYCNLCNFKTLSKEGFRHHLSDNHPSVDVSEAMKNINSFTKTSKIENCLSADIKKENCNTRTTEANESITDSTFKRRNDVKSETDASKIRTMADVIAEKEGIFIPSSISA